LPIGDVISLHIYLFIETLNCSSTTSYVTIAPATCTQIWNKLSCKEIIKTIWKVLIRLFLASKTINILIHLDKSNDTYFTLFILLVVYCIFMRYYEATAIIKLFSLLIVREAIVKYWRIFYWVLIHSYRQHKVPRNRKETHSRKHDVISGE